MQDADLFINGLYLVATPIGNMGDISARATDVLRRADVVACEDTRNTGRLLTLLGISAKTTPYHEYNADKVRPTLMRRLKNGETIALVSDAGTPLVSDPGYKLVRDCIDEGVYVTAVPGASALLTALQLSGLPCRRFLFQGFLPAKKAARMTELKELADAPATLIFYESPLRVPETLADMAAVLGDRKAAVCRELTKKFEETVRDTLENLAAHYDKNGAPKGECVIVVAPPEKRALLENEVEAMLKDALKTLSVKEAAAVVSEAAQMPKKDVYALALKVKNDGK